MRKNILWAAVLLFSGFMLNSCDPWEDESGGDEPDVPEVTLLLKEINKTYTSGTQGKSTYSYDDQNRLIKVVKIDDMSNVQTYVETTYSYSDENKFNLVEKWYEDGEVTITNTMDFELIDSSTAHAMIQSTLISDIHLEITYSTPCGITKMVTSNEAGVISTQTIDYFDDNCSEMSYYDGEWDETIFKDDKFSPIIDPMAVMMGVVQRNPIKTENDFDEVETITYEYNEFDYPVTANHSFNAESGEEDYAETFIYN